MPDCKSPSKQFIQKGDAGGQKRKKSYYKSYSNKRTKFTPFKEGVKGFLITCNKKEHCALKEAYFLLNKYADKCNEEKKLISDDETKKDDLKEKEVEKDVDLEDGLKEELEELKEGRKRFKQLSTKCHNVIFIESHESLIPNEITSSMYNDIKENRQLYVKHVLKMVPVMITCSAHLETIMKTFSNLLDEQPDKATYYIIPKVRNNDSLNRDQLITGIGDIIKEKKKDKWVANFDDAELTICINVIHKISCISILDNFNEFRKYNPSECIATHAKLTQDNLVSTNQGKDNCKVEDNQEKDNCKVEDNQEKDNCKVEDNQEKSTQKVETKTSEEMKKENDEGKKKDTESEDQP